MCRDILQTDNIIFVYYNSIIKAFKLFLEIKQFCEYFLAFILLKINFLLIAVRAHITKKQYNYSSGLEYCMQYKGIKKILIKKIGKI